MPSFSYQLLQIKRNHDPLVITHDRQRQENQPIGIPRDPDTTGRKKRENPTLPRNGRTYYRNFTWEHTSAAGDTHSSRHPGVVLMPRRPPSIERDIPLFLIPHIVKRNVSTHGEELERVTVCRTGKHFYTISTRTKPVKRELRGGGNQRRARDRLNHENAKNG